MYPRLYSDVYSDQRPSYTLRQVSPTNFSCDDTRMARERAEAAVDRAWELNGDKLELLRLLG